MGEARLVGLRSGSACVADAASQIHDMFKTLEQRRLGGLEHPDVY
jgi:hypothetical protein